MQLTKFLISWVISSFLSYFVAGIIKSFFVGSGQNNVEYHLSSPILRNPFDSKNRFRNMYLAIYPMTTAVIEILITMYMQSLSSEIPFYIIAGFLVILESHKIFSFYCSYKFTMLDLSMMWVGDAVNSFQTCFFASLKFEFLVSFFEKRLIILIVASLVYLIVVGGGILVMTYNMKPPETTEKKNENKNENEKENEKENEDEKKKDK
ncbi:transmembrane protein [Anaeramoeba flamelloides]|uniref:Transmembrane protein n=1 Tax=Anaeramoeba flamelloides TaxID=1746091 RepID=A0ABQ8YB99_9EUKA|nr:transmembrane protein [Anaeramoeba flamelloides]